MATLLWFLSINLCLDASAETVTPNQSLLVSQLLACTKERSAERVTVAIYPGSFDPITCGHLDIIDRASRLYERLVVAVAVDTNKHHHFPLPVRMQLIQQTVSSWPNVGVASFEGLTVAFAQQCQAQAIIRGLRAVSDFEFECSMSQMNKSLAPNVETVFMMAGTEYQFLSSSMVKEVCRLGGDVSSLVRLPVLQALKASFGSLTDQSGVS